MYFYFFFIASPPLDQSQLTTKTTNIYQQSITNDNRKEVDVIDELFDKTATITGLSPYFYAGKWDIMGRPEMKTAVRHILNAFSDLRMTIVDLEIPKFVLFSYLLFCRFFLLTFFFFSDFVLLSFFILFIYLF